MATAEGFELVRVRLPLAEAWASGAGSFSHRDSLLVRAVLRGPAGEAEGWGECPALPAPSYSSEYTEEAARVSERFLVPVLLGAELSSAREVAGALSHVKGHPMAKTAFEAAVIDAELRAEGVSMASYLARASELALPPVPAVPAGVTVGLAGHLGQLLDEVERYVVQGYRSVKLKISPALGPPPHVALGAVRERWPEVVLAADANGAYEGLSLDEAASQLSALDGLGLACIEQPLGEDDLVGHARLARLIRTPVCLDEALGSHGLVEAALRLGACSVVNVKAGRLGGYLGAVRVHDLCARREVALRLGGMVETGVARAANVALGSLAGFNLPGDLSATGRFFVEDLAGPLTLQADGTIAVPTGAGSGVEVDRGAIDRAACWRRFFRAG
jgi:O-succinylbenzoate synthase